MKRSFLLMVGILYALLANNTVSAQGSFDETIPSGQLLYFRVLENGTDVAVTGGTSQGAGSSYVIPSSINHEGIIYTVTKIESFIPYSTSISLPNSVTHIGDYAFRGCFSLTSVTMSNGVTYIGDNAFSGCSSLTSVTMSNGVTYIGDNAFYNCPSLTSITIPSEVTYIGEDAFLGCDNLITLNYNARNADILYGGSWRHITTLNIGNDVETIPEGAFSGCQGLTSVSMPNTVTYIGVGAFSGCQGLTSVSMPNTVTYIGVGAFRGCTGLTSVNIPEHVTHIREMTFYDCSSLTSVTIHESIDSIGYYAFACPNLTTLNYNARNAVIYATSYPFGAYAGWQSITELNIGSNVESIPNAAFSGCSGLTSVVIPNSVSVIDTETFSNCTNLSSVSLPDGITAINAAAFARCSTLTNITLPSNLKTIGREAFIDCIGLGAITIPELVEMIGGNAFSGCRNLVTLNYNARRAATERHGSVMNNEIGWHWINRLNIGDNVRVIPNIAFYNCSTLTTVTVPESIDTIGSGAFRTNSEHLTVNYNARNAVISDEISNAVAGAPGWNNSVDTLHIGDGVQTIPANAFYDCWLLSSVNIPNSVVSIGNSAFWGSAITFVAIPNSVTSIGAKAFGWTPVTVVTIGSGVDTIGPEAFADCDNLQSISFLSVVPPSIDSTSFYYEPWDANVVVPCGSLDEYLNAANYNYFTNISGEGNCGSHNDTGGDNNGDDNNGDDNNGDDEGGSGDPSGIETIADASVSIATIGRSILVSGADGMPVSIYDIQGRPLTTIHAAFGQTIRFDVPATGVYMVRVGNIKAQRVAVLR